MSFAIVVRENRNVSSCPYIVSKSVEHQDIIPSAMHFGQHKGFSFTVRYTRYRRGTIFNQADKFSIHLLLPQLQFLIYKMTERLTCRLQVKICFMKTPRERSMIPQFPPLLTMMILEWYLLKASLLQLLTSSLDF